MANYNRSDGTLVAVFNAEVDDSLTDTALNKFNSWCTEMGTPLSTNSAGLNGDDSSFCIITQSSLSYEGMTFVPRFMFSTEAGLGFYSAIPSSTSNASSCPPNINRMYVTSSRPDLFFTYHLPNVDMGSFDTQYKIYSDGFCIYMRHGHYGGTNTFYVAFKVNSSGIYMYFEKGTTTSTIPLYINLWNSNSTWSQFLVTTIFNTTTHTSVVLTSSSYLPTGNAVYGPYNLSKDSILNTIEFGTSDTSVGYERSSDGVNWVSMVVGGVIPAGNVYLRVSLNTSNHLYSPVVTNIWLTEVESDPKILMLKTGAQNRFNNVEGDLTVKFDASKSRLTGSGGPVESFVKTFTPDGLFKKPNPSDFEKLTVSPSLSSLNLVLVIRKLGYSVEKLAIQPSYSIGLTYVGTTNP